MKTKTFIGLLAVATALLFNSSLLAADTAALSDPAKAVLEHYIKIQTQLSKDSVKGVAEQAAAISDAVKNDVAKTVPADVAKQADALAKAKDLPAAREAFKPLSASLVKYLDDTKAGKDVYRHAFCPMANASWLQKGKDIKNPYMGKEML